MLKIKFPLQLLTLSISLCLGFVAFTGFPYLKAQSRQAERAERNIIITGNWKAFTPPKVGLPVSGKMAAVYAVPIIMLAPLRVN